MVRTYPEYTRKSVKRAKDMVKSEHGKLDAITLDFYLRPPKFGGLGIGVLTKRERQRRLNALRAMAIAERRLNILRRKARRIV